MKNFLSVLCALAGVLANHASAFALPPAETPTPAAPTLTQPASPVQAPAATTATQEPPRIFIIRIGTERDGGPDSVQYIGAWLHTREALPPETHQFVIWSVLDVSPRAFSQQGYPDVIWAAAIRPPGKNKQEMLGPAVAHTCFLDEFLNALDMRYGRRAGDLYILYSKQNLLGLQTSMAQHPELKPCQSRRNNESALRDRDYAVITREEDAAMAVEQTLDVLRARLLVCVKGAEEPWCNLTISPFRVFHSPIRPPSFRALLALDSKVPGHVVLAHASYGWDYGKTTKLYEHVTDAEAAKQIRAAFPAVRVAYSVAQRLALHGITPTTTSCQAVWSKRDCIPNQPWTVEVTVHKK